MGRRCVFTFGFLLRCWFRERFGVEVATRLVHVGRQISAGALTNSWKFVIGRRSDDEIIRARSTTFGDQRI